MVRKVGHRFSLLGLALASTVILTFFLHSAMGIECFVCKELSGKGSEGGKTPQLIIPNADPLRPTAAPEYRKDSAGGFITTSFPLGELECTKEELKKKDKSKLIVECDANVNVCYKIAGKGVPLRGLNDDPSNFVLSEIGPEGNAKYDIAIRGCGPGEFVTERLEGTNDTVDDLVAVCKDIKVVKGETTVPLTVCTCSNATVCNNAPGTKTNFGGGNGLMLLLLVAAAVGFITCILFP